MSGKRIMARMLPAALLLILGSPAWATWSYVQSAISSTCTTTSATCNITVSSTGAGHVIAIGMMAANTGETISSVSGGGTYIHPAGCAGSDSGSKATDCAYTLASTSGTSTITVTRASTTSAAWRCVAFEFSFTGSSVSLDVVGNADNTSSSTSPAGVTLTLTGSNDTIVQLIYGIAPTAINAPYATDAIDTGGNAGAADSRNTLSGAAPTWTQTSGKSAVSAIAFAEVGGVAVAKNRTLIGVGK